MGLSGAKNKRRIGEDPNNTKWARNTDTYGHRILRAQGWEPGQFLGPKDEARAAFHTAASASYIRTVLREDNLGLGAAGAGQGTASECTGLDLFKDLLGRLNGTSEAVLEKQRDARETIKRTLYVERRFGPVRFVRGGLLVGDTMKETATDETAAETETATTASGPTGSSDGNPAPETTTSAKKDKKEKKDKEDKSDKKHAKKRKAASDGSNGDSENEDKHSEKKASKRRRRDETDDKASHVPTPTGEDETASGKVDKKNREDKKEKKERRDKKVTKESDKEGRDKMREEKRLKKEKKKEEKKRRKRNESGAPTPATTEADGNASGETTTAAAAAPETDTPASAYPAALVSNRHLARRRYIAQKRAAVMDPQALKQIFMIKT
ncbi:D111/G-patch [Niveomyces insectorum RCEF 264]|uniref:PinX1-related protein 1 n=1 Tax=Niveomyces insectorum RCEF 264 TaxID=1081102 RepID=A0A167UWU4_9HYPO|nr:D111/G-patch [Niveomyces insectorum RCEF 264]